MLLLIIGLLIVLMMAVGAILAFVNAGQIRELKAEVKRLADQVEHQSYQWPNPTSQRSTVTAAPGQQINKDAKQISSVAAESDSVPVNLTNENPHSPNQQPDMQWLPDHQAEPVTAPTPDPSATQRRFSFEQLLQGSGLFWLGALVLALGGVFLAVYTIEAGLFPPIARVCAGFAVGVGLLVAAEFLYRKALQINAESPDISAALASGGLITCFAMVLVAFSFYQFISPTLTFLCLAVIAFSSMGLALRFGPILAAIGIMGAYTVPLLVNTGSSNWTVLLVYAGCISAAAVAVHSWVHRSWLWWLAILGHSFWFFVAIAASPGYQHFLPICLYAALTLYLFAVVDFCGWRLQRQRKYSVPALRLLKPHKQQLAPLLSVFGVTLFALLHGYDPRFSASFWILLIPLLLAPARHRATDSWPFLAVGLCVLHLLLMPLQSTPEGLVALFSGANLFAQVCALGAIAYVFGMRRYIAARPSFLLLLVIAPITFVALSYARNAAHQEVYLLYVVELLAAAAAISWLATKVVLQRPKLAYLLFTNGAIALCLTMLLSASMLTLALTAQITAMAVLTKRYQLQLPNWLYQVALTVVLIRLTAAPWLPAYADEQIFSLNWALVIYPLAFALLWLARRAQTQPQVTQWKTAALLHIGVLFVTTQTGYLLDGHYPVLSDLSVKTMILLSCNWLLIGLVYQWLSKRGTNALVYEWGAMALLTGVGMLHLPLSIFASPFVEEYALGSHFLLNWLLPLWLVPAGALLIAIALGLFAEQATRLAKMAAGLWLFFYINGAIRLLFHPTTVLDQPLLQTELYVYSLVWLLIAVGCIISAHRFRYTPLGQVGFGLLALVVLKAFVVDMSGLEGLYRALSFLGLGLCLVGIGWLFQRLRQPAPLS